MTSYDWSDFAVFQTGNRGIEGWFSDQPTAVKDRLELLAMGHPLGLGEINQLLTLAKEAAMSQGFFTYYFLSEPPHPWNIKGVPKFDPRWFQVAPTQIINADHLYWGIYRLYVDGLLYFGSVRTAYRALRNQSLQDLHEFYKRHRVDSDHMRLRGESLSLHDIETSDRFLIAEQACKAFETPAESVEELSRHLWKEYGSWKEGEKPALSVWRYLSDVKINAHFPGSADSTRDVATTKDHFRKYIEPVIESIATEYDRIGTGAALKIRHFLEEAKLREVLYGLQEITDQDMPKSERALRTAIQPIFTRWKSARDRALLNTDLYLSMVNELDVYVATSMREKRHFESMAANCAKVFGSDALRPFHVRYFDPTLSAARSHEDKGLVECLMVKCAKVLVYYAGERDSYGKDAEAAMALSLGKPVIFYCEDAERQAFFNQVHPLSRLIEFDSGVAVGAMAVSSLDDVANLLERIFENKMTFELAQKPGQPGYLQLKEPISKSVLRLQTNEDLLSTAFWNYYHEGERAGWRL